MANDAFGKIKASVNRGIATISVKTTSTVEKSKIKTHIETLEKEIERAYRIVGEEMYCKWEQQQLDALAFSVQFEAIQQKKREIAELDAELQAVDEKNNQILGSKSEMNAQSTQTQPRFVCPQCGAQYANPVNFCRKCGNKMSE